MMFGIGLLVLCLSPTKPRNKNKIKPAKKLKWWKTKNTPQIMVPYRVKEM
jgi:hypothetical protein